MPVVIRPKSNAWIYYALTTGLVFGLGNTIFGVGCSKLGLWGGSFTGPTVLLLALLYRAIEACIIKCRVGTFVDWDNSNYWVQQEDGQSTDESDVEDVAINQDDNY